MCKHCSVLSCIVQVVRQQGLGRVWNQTIQETMKYERIDIRAKPFDTVDWKGNHVQLESQDVFKKHMIVDVFKKHCDFTPLGS